MFNRSVCLRLQEKCEIHKQLCLASKPRSLKCLQFIGFCKHFSLVENVGDQSRTLLEIWYNPV
jgi:hypothetical protein